jgi:rod shape determining protein RodA
MTMRAYAAAKRTLTLADKLFEVNWGLVALITLIACVGFAMLYSVAGASFSPWAGKQMVYFTVGLVLLVAAALTDIRFWMSIAYPAYAVSMVLLVLVLAVGHTALGAQRWLSFGPLELQPSELMKISLILALARYLHGLSVEDGS